MYKMDKINNGENCNVKMSILFYNSVLSAIELHEFEGHRFLTTFCRITMLELQNNGIKKSNNAFTYFHDEYSKRC